MQKKILCIMIVYLCLLPFTAAGHHSCNRFDFSSLEEEAFRWEGYHGIKVYLPAEDGEEIPFILVKPGKKSKMPCVLLLHGGLGGSKESWLDMECPDKAGVLTWELLQAGYAVAAIDVRFYGELSRDYADVMEQYNDTMANWDWLFPAVCDDVNIAIDYLNSREDIKSGDIALAGSSMGAYFVYYVTANAKPGSMKTAISLVNGIYVPESQLFIGAPQLSAVDIYCPFLMIVGDNDPSYTIDQAEQLYSLIPSKRKDMIEFASEHTLPEGYISEVVRWITRYMPLCSDHNGRCRNYNK